MNFDNLHEIISRYENDLKEIYEGHNELFKWRAVKEWQDAFHSSDSNGSFKEKFSSAKKKFSIFIDNGSYQHPSTGILKLWEKEPAEIERLFSEVLLADYSGDVPKAEAGMMKFLDAYESLRIRYYPRAGSYKISPHIASAFMIMDQPEKNYVFRISAARTMANYMGFEADLGTGTAPNLVNYYKMCDIIVSALKEHESLLEKHFSYLTDEMYRDESLHLLVFDLMHCSGYRGYYTGLVPSRVGKSVKRKNNAGLAAEEYARREQERLEQIASLEKQINDLELSIEDFEEISLIGVEVDFPKYGVGRVVQQKVNTISVQFPETEKDFVLDKAYAMRPRFENDDEVVEVFTTYGRTVAEIEKLKKNLKRLREE